MDLFDKFSSLPKQYEQIKAAGENPFGVCIERVERPTMGIVNGRPTVLAGTNNYLGLTFDENCIDAACDALKTQGTGTTGSRIANGTYAGHRKLEESIASFLDKDSAIVYPTGYQANLGTIAGLCGPEDTVLIDADCHACIYDGVKLSGANVIRFRHNSPQDLEKRLSRIADGDTNVLVIVEGLYSMFGDIAPLKEFVEIKKKYGAYLYVDEAHSFGVFGETGQGVAEAEGVIDEVDFIVGTFSKSLGTIGGFAASSHPEFEFLRVASRPYMFTASISPATVASVTECLEQIRKRGPGLMERLWTNAEKLYRGVTSLGLTVCAPLGPIVAVRMPDKETAVFFWNRLLENGVYVNLAIPPGTPNSSSLLRCSVSAAHTEEDIEAVIRAFEEVAVALSASQAAE